jgi:catechol 2,3-dioxygenase-like lactoylglutathione lyase family enzyme
MPGSTVTELTAHHVGITVTDLERALDFYRDTFGFEVLVRFSVAGDAFETGVGVDGASANFAHLDASGVRLELVEYEPIGDDRRGDSVNDPGSKHLGLGVDDVDAFYDGLASDVETLSEPQTTESGTRILFLRDPEENLVEVIER